MPAIIKSSNTNTDQESKNSSIEIKKMTRKMKEHEMQ